MGCTVTSAQMDCIQKDYEEASEKNEKVDDFGVIEKG